MCPHGQGPKGQPCVRGTQQVVGLETQSEGQQESCRCGNRRLRGAVCLVGGCRVQVQKQQNQPAGGLSYGATQYKKPGQGLPSPDELEDKPGRPAGLVGGLPLDAIGMERKHTERTTCKWTANKNF